MQYIVTLTNDHGHQRTPEQIRKGILYGLEGNQWHCEVEEYDGDYQDYCRAVGLPIYTATELSRKVASGEMTPEEANKLFLSY